MKKIIFPTDFSKASESARTVAINFAITNEADLYIVNIYQMPYVRSGSFSSSLLDVIKKDSHSKMDELAASLREQYPGLKLTDCSILGDPVQTICDLSEELNADLIIMGTHGASGIEEIFLGSNTQAVIKNARVPVLAIPSGFNFKDVNKLAFASDLNFENSSKAIGTIKELSTQFDTELNIVHFADLLEDTETNEDKVKAVFGDIKYKYLEQLATNLDKGIADYIQYEEVNLFMMIHRSHNFWERLFTSSNSEKRAMHTKIPLLVLKED